MFPARWVFFSYKIQPSNDVFMNYNYEGKVTGYGNSLPDKAETRRLNDGIKVRCKGSTTSGIDSSLFRLK